MFEPADAITKLDLKQGIRRVLDTHEPRIKVLNIKVLDESDNNSYRITVNFLIKEYDTAESVEIVLRRLR